MQRIKEDCQHIRYRTIPALEKLKLDLKFFIFQSKPKPTQADLYESNNSQNRYEPSTKPPINYKAPSIAFQLPEINDALEPERVKGQAHHMFSRFLNL